MRMNSDSAVDIRCGFGDGTHRGKSHQAGADGEKVPHARVTRALQYGCQFGRKFREIQMTVTVHIHSGRLSECAPRFKATATTRDAVSRWRSDGLPSKRSGAARD